MNKQNKIDTDPQTQRANSWSTKGQERKREMGEMKKNEIKQRLTNQKPE